MKRFFSPLTLLLVVWALCLLGLVVWRSHRQPGLREKQPQHTKSQRGSSPESSSERSIGPVGRTRIRTMRAATSPSASSSRKILNLAARPKAQHFLAGRVADPDGKPVDQAEVRLEDSLSTRTDAQGRYRFDDLRQTTITRVFVTHPNFQEAGAVYVAADQDNFDFTLQPKTPTTLVGKVLDWKSKAPVSSFSASVDHGTLTQSPATPGEFTVEGIFSGDKLRVNIDSPGYLSRQVNLWISPRSSQKTLQIFLMGPGATLTGRVIDRQTRSPIPQVPIDVHSLSNQMDSPTSSTAQTGADGRFSISSVPPGFCRLAIRPKAPYAEQMRSTNIQHGDSLDMGDIELEQGGIISGRVVRLPGNLPMAGETVSLNGVGGSMGRETTSAPDGTFEFQGVAAGTYGVRMNKYRINEIVTLEKGQKREITLRVGSATLHGLLLRAGQPVEARIGFVRESGGQAGLRVTTKPDGTFEARDLSPGRWEMQIVSRSGQLHTLYTDMPETGDVERTFVLPSSAIVGRVSDASGQPVQGAMILLVLKDPGTAYTSVPTHTRVSLSGSDGSFRLEELSPGHHAIFARKDKVGSSKIAEVDLSETGDSQPVELRLGSEGTGTLVSTALDYSNGVPLPQAWCLLSTQYGRMGHGQQRNDQGVMRIENLPAGKYHVQVSASGYSVAEHDVEIRPGETSTLTDVLYLTGAFRWTLVNSSGVGVEGVQCTVVPDDPSSIESVREGMSDAQGLFLARGLFPGNYHATAALPGRGVVLKIPVAITPNQLTIESSPVK